MNNKRPFAVLVAVCALLLAGTMHAGEIKGKVTAQGLKSAESIAVYVDAIPDKDFPAPAQHVTVAQRPRSMSLWTRSR